MHINLCIFIYVYSFIHSRASSSEALIVFRNSLELQMCKRVLIELEGGASSLNLFQKEFSIITNQNTNHYKPGEYPETCEMKIPNVDVFHVGLFLIVRIYEPNNPFFIKFEVSDIKLKGLWASTD